MRAPFDFDDPHFECRPYDPWTAYAQSKTADVLLAVGLARRWAADGITANAFEPGYLHTARYGIDAACRFPAVSASPASATRRRQVGELAIFGTLDDVASFAGVPADSG